MNTNLYCGQPPPSEGLSEGGYQTILGCGIMIMAVLVIVIFLLVLGLIFA